MVSDHARRMNDVPITPETVVAAFALPPGPPPRRVPKTSLAANLTAVADKRLIDTKLARLEWTAALNPATIGIAGVHQDGLKVKTINLLLARTRSAMPLRMAEVIHRAIPQPVILVHAREGLDAPGAISLASKRAADREPERVVITAIYDSGPLNASDAKYLDSLNLARVHAHDLGALYGAFITRTEALAAARAAQRPFRLSRDEREQMVWKDNLAKHAGIEVEITSLTAAMRRELRLAPRVELGEKVRQLKGALDKCRELLK